MKFLSAGKGSAEMPFLDHLEELRWRILWSVLAILIGSGWVATKLPEPAPAPNRSVRGRATTEVAAS